jgi:hypothetical protein
MPRGFQYGQQPMTRNQTLARMLMQSQRQAPPIQSHSQGLASMFRKGMAGYAQGQDQRDFMEAQGAMGTPLGAGADPYGARRDALGGMPNNPYAVRGAAQSAQSSDAYRMKMQMDEANRRRKLEDAIKLKGSAGAISGRPSSPIQNFARRQEIVGQFGEGSPEVKRFDSYVRATKVMDFGGGFKVLDPSKPGSPVDIGAKTLAPKDKPAVKAEQATAVALGKDIGEAKSKLKATEAALPRLESAVTQLKELGKTATYTMAGQASDALRRQLGQPASEGAKSRAAYIAHVKNNVLPLLRVTFGAAFTVAEGDSLLATLGDPDASPDEKNAVLDAFISDKKAEVGTLRRQTGAPQAQAIAPSADDPLGLR